MAEQKTKERIGIKLDIYPDWTGERYERGIGVEGTITVDAEEDFNEALESVIDSVAEGTVVEPNPAKRSIKLKQNCRLDSMLPVPANDEESQKLFGVPLAELTKEGVKKISYDRDTNIGNMITDALLKGVDFNELENVAPYTAEFEEELRTAKEKAVSQRKIKDRKASEYDQLMQKYNVSSMAELMAFIESQKA